MGKYWWDDTKFYFNDKQRECLKNSISLYSEDLDISENSDSDSNCDLLYDITSTFLLECNKRNVPVYMVDLGNLDSKEVHNYFIAEEYAPRVIRENEELLRTVILSSKITLQNLLHTNSKGTPLAFVVDEKTNMGMVHLILAFNGRMFNLVGVGPEE